MNDVKPLPESVVKSLSEAKITPEYEIFYEKGQWVYQRKQQKANGLERLNSLGPFGKKEKENRNEHFRFICRRYSFC